MKNDNAMVAKPNTNPFLVGLMIIEAIDGMLVRMDAQKQKNTSMPLLK